MKSLLSFRFILLTYPVIFLLVRGNIDGLIFILFAASLFSRSAWVQALALGLGNNLKLYTLLPSAHTAWREGRRLSWLVLGATILLAIPFSSWDRSFFWNLLHRSSTATGTENLSPSLILGALVRTPAVKAGYLLVWLISIGLAAKKLAKLDASRAAARMVPWMIAIPFQVYPYSGILVLIAWPEWLGSPLQRSSKVRDWILSVAFCLIGIQQQALTDLFGRSVHSHRFFPFLNALGVLLLAVSVYFHGRENALSYTAQ